MKYQLHERPVPPDREREIFDVLGYTGETLTQSMLQTVMDCVKILSLDGRLLFVNQVGLDELMGGSLDEVRDTVWSAYWPSATRPVLEEAVELCAGGRHLTCQVPRPTEDGTDRMWSIDFSPVHDRAGSVVAILIMSRDITANVNDVPIGH